MQKLATQMAFAVVIENLTKDYGDVRAVDGLSLSIPEAEVFGLLGPNGSGKTTTINCLTGLIKPSEGILKVGGYDVLTESSKARAVLGVSPQETAIFP
jgi:ABC-2 type transport system ATP-binding protein